MSGTTITITIPTDRLIDTVLPEGATTGIVWLDTPMVAYDTGVVKGMRPEFRLSLPRDGKFISRRASLFPLRLIDEKGETIVVFHNCTDRYDAPKLCEGGKVLLHLTSPKCQEEMCREEMCHFEADILVG